MRPLRIFKGKEDIGFHGGFNLLDTYPLRFCNIVEEISSDSIPKTFEFRVPDQKIEHVIVNLCPTEPWALPDWVILGHKTTTFLNKLKDIKTRYFPEARYSLAISKEAGEAVTEAKKYAENAEWMKVFAVDQKYPQNDPVMLARVILGVNLAFGQDTTVKGIVVLDAQTISAIHESITSGNKVNSRFIAISGTGLKENEIIRVELGTSIEKVLRNRVKKDGKHRVFVNGPLCGREITDLSQEVDWSVNNIVVLEAQDTKMMFPMLKPDELQFTTNLLGELRRCVYCNFCDDICPVNLEPALYYHSYTRGEKHKARLYHLENCIECGLCSFACPSKLELLQIIKECKALDKQP